MTSPLPTLSSVKTREKISQEKPTHLEAEDEEYASRSGLGSVGREILCFLAAELEVELRGGPGSCAEEIFGVEALRANHLVGRLKNPVKPLLGEVDRGNPTASGIADGLSVFAPLRGGAIHES